MALAAAPSFDPTLALEDARMVRALLTSWRADVSALDHLDAALLRVLVLLQHVASLHRARPSARAGTVLDA